MKLALHRSNQTPARVSLAAFTLLETLVSASLLGILAASSIWTLTQSNRFAALSRLNTGAQVAAQNEIDLLLSTGPFNPQKNEFGASRPNQKAPDGSKIIMPRPLALGQTAVRDIVIYKEPAASDGAVREIHGTIVTDVTALPLSAGGRSLNAYAAKVTIVYPYYAPNDPHKGKTYALVSYAVRSSDVDGNF